MTKLAISPADSGTGTVTIKAPVTNTNREIVLPDADDTLAGAAEVQSAVQGGTLYSGVSVASTSGTAIDFTGIPSWAKRITVMFNGVSTNGTSNIQVLLGGTGGIEVTGYIGAIGSRGAETFSSTGIAVSRGQTAAVVGSGVLHLCNVTGNIWTGSGTWAASSTDAPLFFASGKTLSDTLTQLRITTVNGTDTFDAGSINIIWE